MAYHSYNALRSSLDLPEPKGPSKPFFHLWPIFNSGSTKSVAKLHEPTVSKVEGQIDPSESAVLSPRVIEAAEDAPTSLLGNLQVFFEHNVSNSLGDADVIEVTAVSYRRLPSRALIGLQPKALINEKHLLSLIAHHGYTQDTRALAPVAVPRLKVTSTNTHPRVCT